MAHRRRIPLHLQITALFALLIIALGATLSWYNYRKSSAMALSASEKLFQRYGNEISLDFLRTYQPIVQTVNMLTLDAVASAWSLDERLAQLPLLAKALELRPQVIGLHLGYENGDVFTVRPLDSPDMRRTFNAPDDARLMAVNTQLDDLGRRAVERFFFDRRLQPIRRESAGFSDEDPRAQPWYRGAIASDGHLSTAPYFFDRVRRVGITLSSRTPDRTAVVAADVALDSLSQTISSIDISPNSEVVLLDQHFNALAYRDPGKLVLLHDDEVVEVARLDTLGSRVLVAASREVEAGRRAFALEVDGQRWRGQLYRLAPAKGITLELLTLTPERELLGEALQMRSQSSLITAAILILALPLSWLLARQISRPLRQLASEARRIRRFRFTEPRPMRSKIREIDDLEASMSLMRDTLKRFLGLLQSMSEETEFKPLIELITDETMNVSQAAGAAIYLVSEDEKQLQPVSLKVAGNAVSPALLESCNLDSGNPLGRCLQQQQSLQQAVGPDGAHPMRALLDALSLPSFSVISLPLKNRKGEPVGVLCLLYADTDRRPVSDRLAFIETLSGFASITLESRQLIRMEKALLEAFIELIAGAIDAKSPHTAGHCQRVPELTRMLAQAACDSQAPPFRDFHLSREEWEELHIASWLHDCGKVTTPEYVVDKATKLETLYDRIHEIRTRFEVLKRDAEIRYLRAVMAGGEEAELRQALEREWRTLDEEYAFVAQCNLGSERMAEADQDRLQRIAGRTWMRTLDERLGVSWEERQRQADRSGRLPVEEKLLADKPVHIIPREEADRIEPDNPWGFRLDTPEHLYNRGELYNLQIPAGTLTPEERYKINDHIVQTIIMLEKLPYPRHLRRVPEIAGGHHERMDGQGYPKRLHGEQMSLSARMMAIADVFEALTASDRPYKTPKPLSEALGIMFGMGRRGHLDPQLLRLFVESGVCLDYARRFLAPSQVDAFDLAQLLTSEAASVDS
ncbi:phosphodiesterase [Marinobacterium nitratireducens]|uniref:Phosphodiesterase n=1 Tax=Marinobacterium nitratireducens TaxID=518897 RepID=A0A917Z609_9GAMM|nr:HD domain-containing phosphohydrolase [Marinobacterium nitratireducens]GGO75736.1 phosphodiesterase [Marinobacterium nitratireducens]